MSSAKRLTERAVEVCWRQWTSLGVAGVQSQQCAAIIDPEALIVFTAGLGDADPRLRDESTDWCVRYGHRLVSTSRLRNLIKREPEPHRFDDYLATVNAHSSSRWPTSGDTKSRDITVSGKSDLPALRKRSQLVRLQLRAMFGVTARAEVLMMFLVSRPSPEPWFTASDLEVTGYSKRNIAFVLEDLALCELLTARRAGNQLRYRLAERAHLGKLAPAAANALFEKWDLRFHLFSRIMTLHRDHAGTSRAVLSVEARKLVRETSRALAELDISAPLPDAPDDYADAIAEGALDQLLPSSLL